MTTPIDTTKARDALAAIRAAASGDTPISDQAMNVHALTDLSPQDAQLLVTVADNWGHCTGISVAVGMAEATTTLAVALRKACGIQDPE